MSRDLSWLLGYLSTWSAAQRYATAHGLSPVDEMESALREGWGKAVAIELRWRIHLLLGRT